jgi:hypothetical protein
VVADAPGGERVAEGGVRQRQRLHRLRVLSAEQREHRLHIHEDRIEEGVAPAEGRRVLERRHRLVERAADHFVGAVEDRQRLGQRLGGRPASAHGAAVRGGLGHLHPTDLT